MRRTASCSQTPPFSKWNRSLVIYWHWKRRILSNALFTGHHVNKRMDESGNTKGAESSWNVPKDTPRLRKVCVVRLSRTVDVAHCPVIKMCHHENSYWLGRSTRVWRPITRRRNVRFAYLKMTSPDEGWESLSTRSHIGRGISSAFLRVLFMQF